MNELNEVGKKVVIGISITAVVTVLCVATAGIFAGPIAVAIAGSNFAGLSGAALTSACLAYLGGGAIAAGGAGMAGGMAAIIGGGAILGVGAGAGITGAVNAAGLMGKHNAVIQSAKLLVSVREVILNDEHDIDSSNAIYNKFVENILGIEEGITKWKLQAEDETGESKKELKKKIKSAEESVDAMKIARKDLHKFISSFELGMSSET